SSRNPRRNASVRAALVEADPPPRSPIRGTFVDCCASAASGASVKLRARTTASPTSGMGTSVRMAGGSLAEGRYAHQRPGQEQLASGTIYFRTNRSGRSSLTSPSLLGHFLAITIVRHRSAPYFQLRERASQRHDK